MIQTEDLKVIFNKIISKLEYEQVETMNFSEDLYRFIPTDKWSVFTENIIEVGSLTDDLDSLKLLVEDSERPCTYVDFDRVASILRAISQKNNPV